MILSRFLRTFEKEQIVAVFHALDPFPFYVPKEVWSTYLNGEELSVITEILNGRHLLIENAGCDDELVAKIRGNDLLDDIMSILYLMLTKKCNFNCRQCFQEERHSVGKPMPFMTKEVAKLGIDTFARHIQQNDVGALETEIELYGGEPLLNLPVMKFAVEYAEELMGVKKLPQHTILSTVTNGSLIDDGIAEFFYGHHISVGVSVDGPKQQNDEYRLTKDGKGTYDVIMRAIETLKRHKVDFSLSVTINPNIADALPDMIRWAKEEVGVDAIGFNLVGGRSYGYTQTELPKQKYNELVAVGLPKSFAVARELGVAEDRFNRKIEAFANREFLAVDCGALGNQLVIQPDGKIAFCHASTDYNVGSVFDKEFCIFGHPAIEEWKQALPINNIRCRDCSAIAICGYGCFHNVLQENRGVSDLDEQFCLHTQKALEFLVWDLYEKAQ